VALADDYEKPVERIHLQAPKRIGKMPIAMTTADHLQHALPRSAVVQVAVIPGSEFPKIPPGFSSRRNYSKIAGLT
jgi:hypothetical protein